MRIAIVRRAPGSSFSMDVYADGLVSGLTNVRPDWSIVEITPSFTEYQGSSLERIGKYYSRYWKFPNDVKGRDDIDLFHVIDHSDGHLLYALKGHDKATVVTCHDLINYIHPENISDQAQVAFISQALWKYAVRGICQADHIVTVSDHTAKDVRALFQVQPSRITTAHNGVDPSFQQLPQHQVDQARQQYSIAQSTFALLNVGSNHPRKNIFTILRALAILQRVDIPIQFLKAGADFTAAQKSFIEEEGLADAVSYVGKPSQEQLITLYNAADVLVAPSLYEGFGITPLEAMACGTPVVTADVTALPEVIGEAGIMISPEDADAVATAVKTLYQEHGLYQEFVGKGLERVKGFTWRRHGEQVAQVYEKILTSTI